MMDVYEVVKKLVGEINPIGDTNVDKVRLDNLNIMTELVDSLLTDIDAVANNYKNNHQYSMKKASEFASDFFTKIGIEE